MCLHVFARMCVCESHTPHRRCRMRWGLVTSPRGAWTVSSGLAVELGKKTRGEDGVPVAKPRESFVVWFLLEGENTVMKWIHTEGSDWPCSNPHVQFPANLLGSISLSFPVREWGHWQYPSSHKLVEKTQWASRRVLFSPWHVGRFPEFRSSWERISQQLPISGGWQG